MSVINRQQVLEILCEECAYRCKTEEVKLKCCFNYHAIATLPCADVKPVVRGANIATEYAECDQFICSECGIHLQDWNLIEGDYEDGVVHEFVFNFCPNCGVDLRERSEKE